MEPGRAVATRASAIHGSGHGSNHRWARRETALVGAAAAWRKRTEYQCADCGAWFTHRYGLEPDIFAALRTTGVPDRCSGGTAGQQRPDAPAAP